MRKCRYCSGAIEDAATTCPRCQCDLFPTRTAAAAAVPLPAAASEALIAPPARVSVVDVNMPFASMVGFMVKWAIAAIPALLILAAIGAIVAALLAGLFSGVGRP
jgi:hypothetical protein